MDSICQEICEKFGGKVKHTVGPKEYIHPAIMDVVDWAVGDDPLWKSNPYLAAYRAKKEAVAEKDRKRLLMTKKDKLQFYLKAMSNRARRAKYAST